MTTEISIIKVTINSKTNMEKCGNNNIRIPICNKKKKNKRNNKDTELETQYQQNKRKSQFYSTTCCSKMITNYKSPVLITFSKKS